MHPTQWLDPKPPYKPTSRELADEGVGWYAWLITTLKPVDIETFIDMATRHYGEQHVSRYADAMRQYYKAVMRRGGTYYVAKREVF